MYIKMATWGATPCPSLVRLLHRRVHVSVSDGYSAPSPRAILEGSVGKSLRSETIDPET
jgi:hypothetical protein